MAGTEKSDGAFRTIREVADWLAVPTHVLRFWESKFEQIAPVKGAGGRRYYRPEDMRLLGGIKVMLHDQGLTVRGVGQKIADEGLDAVMELSPDLEVSESAPPLTRRVIRPDDDAVPEKAPKVVSFPPRPAPERKDEETEDDQPAPEDETLDAQPDAPDEETDPPQPTDAPDHPELSDDDLRNDAMPPQPDPEMTPQEVPGSDPEAVATDERPVPSEPWQHTPRPVPEDSGEPLDAEFAVEAVRNDPLGRPLGPLEVRRLRRIVRKLRGLIEEIEEDLAQDGSR